MQKDHVLFHHDPNPACVNRLVFRLLIDKPATKHKHRTTNKFKENELTKTQKKKKRRQGHVTTMIAVSLTYLLITCLYKLAWEDPT
jgi:hypothetical protein